MTPFPSPPFSRCSSLPSSVLLLLLMRQCALCPGIFDQYDGRRPRRVVGGINDPIFGGTPEGKIWDPLGLGADEASLYRRRVVVEIKHGRVCMVAFLGMTVGPNETVRCQSFVNM